MFKKKITSGEATGFQPSLQKKRSRGKKILERIAEGLLTFSGGISIIIILLITIFLFKEGMGLFQSPAVEKGYQLCVNPDNKIENIKSSDIKRIFDYEITNWKELGGEDLTITPFYFEEIFDYYSEDELGED